MPYNFSQFKEKTNAVVAWLQKECSLIRTGRATPNLLDGILVESYGSKVSLAQSDSLGYGNVKTY